MSPTNSTTPTRSRKPKSTSTSPIGPSTTTPTHSVHRARITKPSPPRLSTPSTAKLHRAALVYMEAEEGSSSSDGSVSDEGEGEAITMCYDENMDVVMRVVWADSDTSEEEEEFEEDEYEIEGIDDSDEEGYEVDGEYEARNEYDGDCEGEEEAGEEGDEDVEMEMEDEE